MTVSLLASIRHINLLPSDGVVNYYGLIFQADAAACHFAKLLETIAWKNDEAIIFGKRIVTARKVAWYGDSPFSYNYSGSSKQALPWTDSLLDLKRTVEEWTGTQYNSCLLNLYPSGEQGVAWHSDGEKCLAEGAPIASLSFGAERTFRFKHKQTGETISIVLENGSLLVMQGATQKHWLHSLPKSKRIRSPRINLTFRTMQAALNRSVDSSLETPA